MDQHSLRSVSTFDLPSPALSLNDGKKTQNTKSDKTSWVWRWAEKRDDANGNTRIYCLVPRCTQKKGWALMRGSTTNIKHHLTIDHKLHEHSEKDGAQTGSIESIFANQGKRSSAHFSTDALERQVCKILVRHKLPYTFVQSSLVQELLDLAHAAPSIEDLKLPSNDAIARR
ncbi:hypothetical protein BGX26_007806, partial [Mortierella sp. AD094]